MFQIADSTLTYLHTEVIADAQLGDKEHHWSMKEDGRQKTQRRLASH